MKMRSLLFPAPSVLNNRNLNSSTLLGKLMHSCKAYGRSCPVVFSLLEQVEGLAVGVVECRVEIMVSPLR